MIFFKGPCCKQITDDKTIVGIINTDVVPEMKADDFYTEPDWKTLAKEHHDKLYGEKHWKKQLLPKCWMDKLHLSSH